MPRKIIAALVGIAIAVVTVILMEWLSHTLFPLPTDIDFSDPETLDTLMASAPVGALILVLVGYVMGTFDGVFVACLIGRTNQNGYALLIGALMLAGTVATLVEIAHPTWFSVSAIVGIIIAAWSAAIVAPKVRFPGAEPE